MVTAINPLTKRPVYQMFVLLSRPEPQSTSEVTLVFSQCSVDHLFDLISMTWLIFPLDNLRVANFYTEPFQPGLYFAG